MLRMIAHRFSGGRLALEVGRSAAGAAQALRYGSIHLDVPNLARRALKA
jgi:hypothetical protein